MYSGLSEKVVKRVFNLTEYSLEKKITGYK